MMHSERRNASAFPKSAALFLGGFSEAQFHTSITHDQRLVALVVELMGTGQQASSSEGSV
jgi:hypothetical protein